MPFGLDIKSMVIGAAIAWFVIPFVLSLIASKKTATS